MQKLFNPLAFTKYTSGLSDVILIKAVFFMLKYLVIIYYEAWVISKDYDAVGEDTMITAFDLYNDDDNADNGSVLSEMRFKFVPIKARELFISLIIDWYFELL